MGRRIAVFLWVLALAVLYRFFDNFKGMTLVVVDVPTTTGRSSNMTSGNNNNTKVRNRKRKYSLRVIQLDDLILMPDITIYNKTGDGNETDFVLLGAPEIYKHKEDYFHDPPRGYEIPSNCTFQEDWQAATMAKTTCNLIHETGVRILLDDDIGLSSLLPGGSGTIKQVWDLVGAVQDTHNVIFKTNLGTKPTKSMQRDVMDANIMEAAMSRKHIMNIHGWCYQSSLLERASMTMGHWVKENIRGPVEAKNGKISKKLSRRIVETSMVLAQGLLDMQLRTEESPLPKVVHADLKIPQYLLGSDGVVKLNDFNLAHMLTVQSNQVHPTRICPYRYPRIRNSIKFAPEAHQPDVVKSDKLDISALGSMFYELLTNQYPYKQSWDGVHDASSIYVEGKRLHKEEALRQSDSGVPPSFPPYISQSNDTYIQAMVEMILKCKQVDQWKRPDVTEITDFLNATLQQNN